ncbi:penicillin-binding protein activator LpoB [Thiotrichales bacterium 19S9-12]|nr:penicillin-binding protein activator LpoB [Thiotrichales bacterium 19S9-11]MCF6811463.1 penicillin-binding protein activator LpoB [Thiotrichales bacterium 19S9-12]
MMKRQLNLITGFISIVLSALILVGCAEKVEYTNPNEVDTTAIGFSSTDLQVTTQKMVDSMLQSSSIKRVTDNGKTQPVVFFSGIRNETNEHINTNLLENTVSTRMINSGYFQFTDMKQVDAMKKQFDYQQQSGMIDQKTAVQMGQQLGAHYMFAGSIGNIYAQGSSQDSNFFLITLKMINLKTGTIVWQEEKQIRKTEKRTLFGW